MQIGIADKDIVHPTERPKLYAVGAGGKEGSGSSWPAGTDYAARSEIAIGQRWAVLEASAG